MRRIRACFCRTWQTRFLANLHVSPRGWNLRQPWAEGVLTSGLILTLLGSAGCRDPEVPQADPEQVEQLRDDFEQLAEEA